VIGKKVPNPNKSSSKAVRVISLTDYVVDPDHEQERENEAEKCLYDGSRGFVLAEDHEARKAEMLALALVAVKSPDPIDHWVISWQEGEQPTPEQIEEAVSIFAKEMGVEGHQMIYGLHADTENYHLHIALNRVNPDTEKVVKINRGFDHEAALLAVERIEEAQGWKREAGAIHRERDDKGQIIRVGERVPQPNAKARQFEVRTGTKSAERIAQEDLGPIIRDSQTWGELHKRLAAIGVEYQQKGSGAILRVGELNVKASRAGRDCGHGELVKRLGEFQPAQDISVQRRAPEPVKIEHKELWAAFTKERDQWRAQKEQDRTAMQKRHEAERTQANADYKQRRETFIKSRSNWKGYGQILNANRSVLAAQQAAIMADLRDRQKMERSEFQAERPSFPDFEKWMRREKEVERADEFRYRHDQARIVGPEYKSPRPRDIRDFTAEIANGAVVYRAKGASAASFVDRGRQIDISQSNNREAVLAALQLSAQKWGAFYVYGSDQYKRLCVELAAQHGFKIANPELQATIQEARRPKREEPAVAPLQRGASAGDVYRKHFEDIKARQNGDGKLDPSRVDSMIAVRMMATGHERREIEATIARFAPTIRKGEQRDWKTYAVRTASFAFGPGGDRQLANLERYVPQWMKLEGMNRDAAKSHEHSAEWKPDHTKSERLLMFADLLKQNTTVLRDRETTEGLLNAIQGEPRGTNFFANLADRLQPGQSVEHNIRQLFKLKIERDPRGPLVSKVTPLPGRAAEIREKVRDYATRMHVREAQPPQREKQQEHSQTRDNSLGR
jgi:hypothetical protein